MSVVTCREVLEHHGILYLGEHLAVLFEIMIHDKQK